MEPRGYIGIDFGTTNSHFAYSELGEGAPRATAITLDAAENHLSTTSCVLWRQPARTEQDVFLYGDKAIEEWLMMDADERSAHRFAAGFKPDLAASETARLDALAFLRQAYLEMRSHRTPPLIGDAEGMPVVIGVPARASEAHRTATAAVARDAGFGQVECLAEPLGALGYHLAHGQLTEEEVERGILVVDFGGGTLDIAWLDQDGVREPWGDPLLGGRLFDDLFFQWVTESSGVDLAEFREGELLYAWLVRCRQLKERFSRHWQHRKGAGAAGFDDFKGRVELSHGQTLGMLRNAGLDEFIARARNYRPSAVARDYFERIGSDLRHLDAARPVDLLRRIRDSIAGGPALSPERDYAIVILTGGSSSWPFMPDLVGELFAVPPERILCASSPERTVGEGIAIYNVLRRRHIRARQRIREELPELKREIHRHVDQAVQKVASQVASGVLDEVMKVARTQYFAWHDNGGALASVEARVREDCERIPANEIARKRLAALTRALEGEVHEIVRTWLKRQGVDKDYGAAALDAAAVPDEIVGFSLQLDIGETLSSQITNILSVIVATIVAAMSGGSGMALITSGPLGLALGAAIGGAAVLVGQGQIRKMLREYDFQGPALAALQRLYSKDKLENAMREAEQDLHIALQAPMRSEIQRLTPALEQHANVAANAALKRFDVLERLR